MDFTRVDPIARALLYEGYLLYPYRSSSLKNCRPSAFGSLRPQAESLANGESEPWSMQIECLVHADASSTLQGRVRFLHRDEPGDVVERDIALPPSTLHDLVQRSARISFMFPTGNAQSLEGCAELWVEPVFDSVFKLRLRIENVSPIQDTYNSLCLAYTMISTHAVLGVTGGRFLSPTDPPEFVHDASETCRNRGAWPVLVGDRDRQDMILAAPIILYDYPQIAPESPGNLFDGTEIDEILSLRILTLTDSEKQAMRADERSRTLLERTEALAGHQLLALHGAVRDIQQGGAPVRFQPGDRVRLRPSTVVRQDILDLALVGMPATIASIEQDFEGQVFYTVTLDDDPGRDLGMEGKPGHRFFFRRQELESLSGDA